MVRYYECAKCGRQLSRRWLPPLSGSVRCKCGATVRLSRRAFVNTWEWWSLERGWGLGAAATLVVMLAMLSGRAPWPAYLFLPLTVGGVSALPVGALGAVAGRILAWRNGLSA